MVGGHWEAWHSALPVTGLVALAVPQQGTPEPCAAHFHPMGVAGPSGTATFGDFLVSPSKLLLFPLPCPSLPLITSTHSLPAFLQVLVHGKYHHFGKEDLQTLQQPCVFWVLCNAKLLAGSHYNLSFWSGEHLLPIPQSSPVSCVILNKLLIF